MIHFDRISKVYPTKLGPVRALDAVTLRVAAGEFVAVRGPSGCGKSTLLSIAGGLTSPSGGIVSVAQRDLGAMSAQERDRFRAETIGFVFQMFHLLPYLNVMDNVLVGASTTDSNAAGARAEALLERFSLVERRGHYPPQLSAGERQRVAMARALLNRPQLLLADEPTGNLDPHSAETVLDQLSEFHRDGGTVLLVTHDERAAGRAERTLLLRSGHVEQEHAVA